jgi:hypothetical protein
MSFCASCGRQREGSARFCGGCGTEFTDPAPAHSDVDRPADARVEPPAAQTDPFASWYQQEAPAAETNWQPTQTVRPAPSYPPPAPPPPVYPSGPPTLPPSRGSRGRGLFIAVTVVVVLAAGGGAYALATSLGKHSDAQPPASPTVSASALPTASAPSTSAATPSPTLSLVAISPSVTSSAAEPQAEALLSHYFQGINTHSYPEYAGTLNAQQLASQSQSKFESGYSTTTDSGMTLTGLTGNGNGGLTATVTFTSRQSPSDSVDNSSCNNWTLNFYLVPQGNGYLIGPAPSGYQPTYSNC